MYNKNVYTINIFFRYGMMLGKWSMTQKRVCGCGLMEVPAIRMTTWLYTKSSRFQPQAGVLQVYHQPSVWFFFFYPF